MGGSVLHLSQDRDKRKVVMNTVMKSGSVVKTAV
jgi:hypothetical protein